MENEKRPFLYSLRSKLFLAFIITLLIPMAIATVYAIRSLEKNTTEEIKDKLSADLNTAIFIYEKQMERMKSLAGFASMNNTMKITLKLRTKAQLEEYLSQLLRENDLEMLTVTDARGVVFARGTEAKSPGKDLSGNRIVKSALMKTVVCGTEIIPLEGLKVGRGNRKKATVEESETLETMMIVGASPVYGGDRVLGSLVVGIRLNNNAQIVEEIKERRGVEVFIFQGNKIISTTFKYEDEKQILEKGLPYIMKSNEWQQGKMSLLNIDTGRGEYLIAYYPLSNINNKQIGGIAVAESTKKMAVMKRATVNNMFVISGGGVLLAMILAAFISYIISKPIQKTIEAMSTTETGGLPQTVDVKSRDEIGRLAQVHNKMVTSLKKSREEIEQWNRELEDRVDKRAKELKESEEKYKQLVEQSFYGIYIFQDNKIKFANEEFQRISGYSLDELKGMDFWELVAPENRKFIKEKGLRGQKGKEGQELYNIKGLKKDGTVIDIEVQAKNVEYEGSLAVQGIVRDITERKRLEEKQMGLQEELLKESKLSAVGLLAQGIAHNINSPLTGILGRAELMSIRVKRLKEGLLNVSKEKEINELDNRLSELDQNLKDSETIIKRVNELSGIIKNMTNKGRQEQDERTRPLNLTELLEEELEFLKADIRFKHEIKKIFNFDKSLPHVNGVYSDFSQSFVNIIRNAIDAMYNSEKKELTITTRHNEESIFVDIHDTGCGINEEEKQKIFDPFFTTKQLHGSDGPTGTGLGLHSAYTLLNKYGARITVKSEPDDTMFTIEIPYTQ